MKKYDIMFFFLNFSDIFQETDCLFPPFQKNSLFKTKFCVKQGQLLTKHLLKRQNVQFRIKKANTSKTDKKPAVRFLGKPV